MPWHAWPHSMHTGNVTRPGLSQAAAVVESHRPSSGWPQEGRVAFHHYSAKYREELDLALSDISLDVAPGTKVSGAAPIIICARTSYSSSLLISESVPCFVLSGMGVWRHDSMGDSVYPCLPVCSGGHCGSHWGRQVLPVSGSVPNHGGGRWLYHCGWSGRCQHWSPRPQVKDHHHTTGWPYLLPAGLGEWE